jgi:hypothetical protein
MLADVVSGALMLAYCTPDPDMTGLIEVGSEWIDTRLYSLKPNGRQQAVRGANNSVVYKHSMGAFVLRPALPFARIVGSRKRSPSTAPLHLL